MRIATANAYESSLSNLQRRQQALTDAQQQLTSGKRVMRVSDDPTASAQAARALASETRINAQQRALEASKSSLQLSESALGSAGELLQQARELVVSAGNGSYTAGDRIIVARQLQGLRDDLLAAANTQDADGRYLFGGSGNGTRAFVEASPRPDPRPEIVAGSGVYVPIPVSYSGGGINGGYQNSAADPSRDDLPLTLSMDGVKVWGDNAPDISVFEALDQTISQLTDPAAQGGPQVAQAVTQGLGRIDEVSGRLASWRSSAGAALNTGDRLGSQLSQAKLDSQVQRSNAEDLDMLEAISDFQNKQTGYDAAMKTYSIVQRMSLFDYIK
jgi:flagellar hook-associated protein 3 FlgL